jgi:hypothetical protein
MAKQVGATLTQVRLDNGGRGRTDSRSESIELPTRGSHPARLCPIRADLRLSRQPDESCHDAGSD